MKPADLSAWLEKSIALDRVPLSVRAMYCSWWPWLKLWFSTRFWNLVIILDVLDVCGEISMCFDHLDVFVHECKPWFGSNFLYTLWIGMKLGSARSTVNLVTARCGTERQRRCNDCLGVGNLTATQKYWKCAKMLKMLKISSLQKINAKFYGEKSWTFMKNPPKTRLKRGPKSMTNLCNFGTCESLFFCKESSVKMKFPQNQRSDNSLKIN